VRFGNVEKAISQLNRKLIKDRIHIADKDRLAGVNKRGRYRDAEEDGAT